MSIKPFLELLERRQLGAALAANALHKPFYKLSFPAALADAGLLQRLHAGPLSFDALAAGSTAHAKSREALQAWLQMGCRLGLLLRSDRGYALAGLAKKLAQPHNDATLALPQEVAGLHYRLITQTPAKLRASELWGLDNQDGELTARSSRALEAFQLQALERFVPASGRCHLLEIGCGSGIYIRHAALLNPQLSALGLELHEDVARVAQHNIRGWGLPERDGPVPIRSKPASAPMPS